MLMTEVPPNPELDIRIQREMPEEEHDALLRWCAQNADEVTVYRLITTTVGGNNWIEVVNPYHIMLAAEYDGGSPIGSSVPFGKSFTVNLIVRFTSRHTKMAFQLATGVVS